MAEQCEELIQLVRAEANYVYGPNLVGHNPARRRAALSSCRSCLTLKAEVDDRGVWGQCDACLASPTCETECPRPEADCGGQLRFGALRPAPINGLPWRLQHRGPYRSTAGRDVPLVDALRTLLIAPTADLRATINDSKFAGGLPGGRVSEA